MNGGLGEMLFNKSKNKKIMERVKIADTHWKKTKGLMFANKSEFDYALVFDLGRDARKSASVHMLFVFFPIDVVYVDKEKKVVDIAKGLQPFTPNYTPKERSRFFIEMPEGKSSEIEIGDFLEW